MEDEFVGAENLEDGELWLPSDFFSMDEVQVVSNKITTPLHYCSSSSSSRPSRIEDFHLFSFGRHPHSHTLFKPLPTLQRFKPPVCYGFSDGTRDLCDCEARGRWTGCSPGYLLPRVNRVQPQVETFMGERAWALQRQQRNRVVLNRVLPGVGMSTHGGTGVFLPRTSSNIMLSATVTKNHNHPCVRKGQRMMNKHEIQLPPRKFLLNRSREDCRGHVNGEMGLPNNLTR